MRISQFLICFGILFSGCASLSLENQLMTANQRVYSASQAAVILNQELQNQKITLESTYQDPHISSIVQKLAKAAGVSAPFEARVYPNTEANAFSIGGKYVFISSGMLQQFQGNQNLIAGVLAHEMAHDLAGHQRRLQSQLLLPTVSAQLIQELSKTRQPSLGTFANATDQLTSLKFSRNYEKEADILGTIYAKRAGFNPEGLVDFFEQSRGSGLSSSWISFLSTHPSDPDRIASIRRVNNYLDRRISWQQLSAEDPQASFVFNALSKAQSDQTQALSVGRARSV